MIPAVVRAVALPSLATLVVVLSPGRVAAQQPPAEALATAPELLRPVLEAAPRAIRRDVPLPRSIRRAFAAGSRDFSGRPGPNYWQLETDFTIRARLDRASQSIFGSERIVVHNHSPDELGRLVLRLDHNLFRARAQRGPSMPAELTDGMVITRIMVDGAEVDLTPRRRRRGERQERKAASVSGLDRTVATIQLGEPIAAGADATVEIDWHTKLPGGDDGRGHRMTQRWADTLFQPTQWFPRLAKYDDLNGWETSPYLGPAEFYNNFGRFDVSLDVPAGWIVTATGVLQNPDEVLTAAARERLAGVLESDAEVTIVGPDEVGPGRSTAAGDRLVWHFVAERVNDFAWATAENYVWKATRATIPGKGPIPIHIVHLPERADRFARAGAITRHALEFYSTLWVPYPFPQLTLQDGPSAGMEYPMVINSNQGAADHETGHQWWPMMLGTNETRYGWMDEGFNTYMNTLSAADQRGTVASFDGRGQSYGQISGDEDEPPLMWNSNYAGDQYGFQAYMKAPLMLSMLGGIVGDDAVQRAMREYTAAWAFKHPSPWDFAFFMSNALGQDLGWFWYYWLWTTESVEGSIEGVEVVGNDTVVTVRQAGQMPSPVVLRVEFAAAGPAPEPMANAVMQPDGAAIVTWPVDVWFDGGRTFAARLRFGERAIERITLDPGGRFPDRDKQDNVWPR
ncbi:MAG: M1 family metallopeptidase [Planctomycetes bacterium]|nr:M1 family metallopeptidase [Planctomycetota bacterium]